MPLFLLQLGIKTSGGTYAVHSHMNDLQQLACQHTQLKPACWCAPFLFVPSTHASRLQAQQVCEKSRSVHGCRHQQCMQWTTCGSMRLCAPKTLSASVSRNVDAQQ
ncbi:hypothetical protein COO60DRAFT_1513989 [Scenedesmus sp. NREL 46B-D3]|nr:hypothetical protein COO60DRAFT_1513989 [Scenedesmus sp. NREL 46B-D3]